MVVIVRMFLIAIITDGIGTPTLDFCDPLGNLNQIFKYYNINIM